MAIFLGTDQWPWTKVATTAVTTALPGPGSRNHATSANLAEISLVGKEANSFSIKAYGKNTGSNLNCRALLQVIGLSPPTGGGLTESMGIYFGTLLFELGETGSSTGIFTTAGSPYKFAHKVLVLDDATNKPPGYRIVGDEDDAWAEIIFDAMGCKKILVNLTNIDPAPVSPNPTAEIGYCWRPV